MRRKVAHNAKHVMAIHILFLLVLEPVSRPDLACVHWLKSELKGGGFRFQPIVVMLGVDEQWVQKDRMGINPHLLPLNKRNLFSLLLNSFRTDLLVECLFSYHK